MKASAFCPFRCGWESQTGDDAAERESLCAHLRIEHGARHERNGFAVNGTADAGKPRGLTAYFVHYRGELTDEVRLALDRPGFTVIDAGHRPDAGGAGEDPLGDMAVDQVVRVNAHSADEAERMVVEALGRRPDHVRVR